MRIPTFVYKWIGKLGSSQPPKSDTLDHPKVNLHEGLYHPPSPDKYELVDYSVLIERHQTLIRDIYMEFGVTEEEFQKQIMPLIEHAAKQLHLLPSSKEHHHHTQGGAFHHSLEVAFLALRRSNMLSIHMRYPPIHHDRIKFDLKLAFFIGGLWHDMAKPVTDLKIIIDGDEWNPLIETLYDFAKTRDAKDYTVNWVNNRSYGLHDHYAAQIFGAFISKLKISLHEDIHLELTNHFRRSTNIMTDILIRSDQDSTSKDLVAVGNSLKRPLPAVELMEALRQLSQTDEYAINSSPDYMLVYTNSGLYLRFGDNFKTLFHVLKTNNPNTICPYDPVIMCKYLSQAGYVEIDHSYEHDSSSAYVHKLDQNRIPHQHRQCLEFAYVKFTHPFHLLDEIPEPIEPQVQAANEPEPLDESHDSNGTQSRNVKPQANRGKDTRSYEDLIPEGLQPESSSSTHKSHIKAEPEAESASPASKVGQIKKSEPEPTIFTDDSITKTITKVATKEINLPKMPPELRQFFLYLLDTLKKHGKSKIVNFHQSGMTVSKSIILPYFVENYPDIDFEEYIGKIEGNKKLINSIQHIDNSRYFVITFSKPIGRFIQQGIKND